MLTQFSFFQWKRVQRNFLDEYFTHIWSLVIAIFYQNGRLSLGFIEMTHKKLIVGVSKYHSYVKIMYV